MRPAAGTPTQDPRLRSDHGGVDPSTLAGIVIAFVALYILMMLEGASMASIFLPAPLILIFGATFGAAMGGGTLSDNKRIVTFFKLALIAPTVPSSNEQIEVLVKLSERARRDGLLALEDEAKNIEDPFLKKGLQLCVDGTDSEDLRDIMEAEIASKKAEDKIASKFFMAMGGYAPTIGIVGTVVGLIHVLENLSKPESLGPLIAGAFVATLWGVLSANFFWLPMGTKIARVSDVQVAQMELLVEGLSEIQAGSLPRAVRQKLMALIPPSEVPKDTAA